MKRKYILLGVIIICFGFAMMSLLFGFYWFKIRRTAYSIATLHSGLQIHGGHEVVTFEDEWGLFPGDGYSLVIMKLSPGVERDLQRQCVKKHYSKLPIKEILPDDTIYDYIDKNDSSGYYLLDIEEEDNRNYTLVILDLSNDELIVYYVLY